MKKLDLSASDLQCALQAFKGGANCVHLTQALPLEDLRKLKQFCLSNSKEFLIPDNLLEPRIFQYINPNDEDPSQLLSFEVEDHNPQLSYWTARYHRLVLDGSAQEETSLQWAQKSMQEAGEGIPVGTIIKILSNKATVRFTEPVAIHDTLQVTFKDESVEFNLTEVEPPMPFIPAGRTVTINFPTTSFHTKPQSGTPVVRRTCGPFPLEDENIKVYKKPVDVEVTITNSSVTIGNTTFPTNVMKAEKPKDLAVLFTDLLSSSDKSLFTLGALTVHNESSWDTPFIPLSELKKMKRAFYENLDAQLL